MKTILSLLLFAFTSIVHSADFRQMYGSPDSGYFIVDCIQSAQNKCTIRAFAITSCLMVSSVQEFTGETVRPSADGKRWQTIRTDTDNGCHTRFVNSIDNNAMHSEMTVTSLPGQQCDLEHVTESTLSALPEDTKIKLPVAGCDEIQILH